MMRCGKTFTGRAALIWIILFFAVVATVNGIMIWFSFASDPARRTDHAAKTEVTALWPVGRDSIEGNGHG